MPSSQKVITSFQAFDLNLLPTQHLFLCVLHAPPRPAPPRPSHLSLFEHPINNIVQIMKLRIFSSRTKIALHISRNKVCILALMLVAGISPRKSGFNPRAVSVIIVVETIALEQIFLWALRFYPANYHSINTPSRMVVTSTWWESLVLPMIPRAMPAGA
jgi:hypothetical protein